MASSLVSSRVPSPCCAGYNQRGFEASVLASSGPSHIHEFQAVGSVCVSETVATETGRFSGTPVGVCNVTNVQLQSKVLKGLDEAWVAPSMVGAASKVEARSFSIADVVKSPHVYNVRPAPADVAVRHHNETNVT